MTRLRVLDLFAGCGGMSYGLSSIGFEVKWANEIWEPAAKTYRTVHPEAEVYCIDISEFIIRIIEKDKSLPVAGDVDVVIGGPPCQGFCGINRYRDFKDPRNSLVESFFEVIELLKPRYVLMENVTGMLSLEDGKAVKSLLENLNSIGYQCRLCILQIGSFGIPQNRWRIFIIAADKRCELPRVPVPLHSFPSTTAFDTKLFKDFIVKPPTKEPNLFNMPLPNVTVGDAISDLPEISHGEEYEGAYILPAQSKYQALLRNTTGVITGHVSPRLGALNEERINNLPKVPGAGWKDLPDHLQPMNLVRIASVNNNRFTHRFGRLDMNGIFNTILRKPEPLWGRIIHPSQNRLISVRESARAQGLSDFINFSGRVSEKYAQIGNAVPPPMARALGWEIRRAAGDNSVDEEIEAYRRAMQ